MSDLDERIVSGLRELVDRAPVAADVWVETERRVREAQASPADNGRRDRHRDRGGAGLSLVCRSTGSEQHVHVATTTPETTSTTSPVTTQEDVCPVGCVGQTTADVDGDGRIDKIGLFANPPLSGDALGNSPSKIVVRVVFANGSRCRI